MNPPRLVVLISGRGSNLQAISAAIDADCLQAEIGAVISNRPDAGGLAWARRRGLATTVVDHRTHPERPRFDQALTAAIDSYRPAWVILAGFMRLLGSAFVSHYQGRLLNIHPSLLPAYRGLDTHARVLAAGDRWHGASVHFVSAALDSGPVIAQARVPVQAGDDAERLAARVLAQEHRLYPWAIGLCASGRIVLAGNQVQYDDRPLSNALQLPPEYP